MLVVNNAVIDIKKIINNNLTEQVPIRKMILL